MPRLLLVLSLPYLFCGKWQSTKHTILPELFQEYYTQTKKLGPAKKSLALHLAYLIFAKIS